MSRSSEGLARAEDLLPRWFPHVPGELILVVASQASVLLNVELRRDACLCNNGSWLSPT